MAPARLSRCPCVSCSVGSGDMDGFLRADRAAAPEFPRRPWPMAAAGTFLHPFPWSESYSPGMTMSV
uniref:Uncharacterized protein n=1 Tax=Pan troglodytes TaxID=9598 RepID=A0A2I3SJJ4_PANTR